MQIVNKTDFIKMFELGIIDGKHKGRKNWYICSAGKGGKRKKRYVTEEDYESYKRRMIK